MVIHHMRTTMAYTKDIKQIDVFLFFSLSELNNALTISSAQNLKS